MSDPAGAAVDLRGIRKSFGGTQALRGVTFAARAGEVTALVGENGAGKIHPLECAFGRNAR